MVRFKFPADEPRINGLGSLPTLYHLVLSFGDVGLFNKIVAVELGIYIAGGSGKAPKALPN